METNIRKGYYGWIATTDLTKGGKLYQITTMKRYNKRVTTNAQEVESISSEGGFTVTKYSPFENACYKLADTDKRATKNLILNQHIEAVNQFIKED